MGFEITMEVFRTGLKVNVNDIASLRRNDKNFYTLQVSKETDMCLPT